MQMQQEFEMNLDSEDKETLARIAAANPGNLEKALEQAYEAGVVRGALRTARNIANKGSVDANDHDEEDTGSLTTADILQLKNLHIDPSKKMYQRNSQFTIVGYKPSRWKYPISVITQNGSRYKMTVQQVLDLQK